jgi:CheY-like chemotaxis protein
VARILIVEDHPTMRAAIRAVLEPAGHQVEEAGDGTSALRVIGEGPPDLVVLDLHIPGVPGEQVLAEVKGSPRTRHVVVVVVTAAGEEARAAALAAGADAYFTKPFGPAALLRTVSQALGADAPGGS